MIHTSKTPVKAFIWATAGAIFLVLADFIIKNITATGTSMATLFFFAWPSGAIFLLILSRNVGGVRHHLYPKYPKTLFIRGLFLVMAGYFLFNSLLHNPFSQHIMITQLAPVFTLIFSVIFFKEALNKQIYIVILLCVLGLWLIIDPRFDSASSFLFLALITAIIQGGSHTFVAGNAHRVTPLGFTFWGTGLLAFVGGILWLLFERDVPDLKTLFWIQLTSLSACVGLAMLAYALQQARPNVGQVSVMLYIQTPAAIFLGWFFFNEKLAMNSIIGACLIIGAGAYLATNNSSKVNRAVTDEI